MFLKIAIKKRILPTLYGGIIGDMLGVPVEFKKRGTFHINDVTGYGTYNQPPGTWSDDTSMTLCLVETLTENGSPLDLMKKFVQYEENGYLTPHGKMFDIGIATVKAIRRFKEGTPLAQCGGTSEYDNGNGAIMRISPLALILNNNFDFDKHIKIIKEYTEITHAHPRAIVGSFIYVELLVRMSLNDSLEKAIQNIQVLFNHIFNEDHPYQKEFRHYKRIFKDNFFNTPEEEILSGGYVVHTLEAAIWCLGTTSSFKEAVLKAVNLGDDTDTVGAITGALAGMHYKMEGIPKDWLERRVRKDKVDELIKDFCDARVEQDMKEGKY
ncbi:ADP-ribosylglycohydrolase family protein [Priestia endophytica]|uniref:ADP-ribosylglycohydrolase family protein n=1 Tax=Priestia endophytica TaxID=135735 RepID=UPI001CEF8CD8|nr:ADP-ribosylglycohydrolase family protein [Priestia endophytica]